MKAEIITELRALAAIEADWWDLYDRVPRASPFASPAWLLPWWRVFAPDHDVFGSNRSEDMNVIDSNQIEHDVVRKPVPNFRHHAVSRLMSIAVRRRGRLVALAPLYVEAGPPRRLLPLGIGISDELDVLMDPAAVDEAGPVLARTIAETGGFWDLWSAEEAPPDAAVLSLPDPPGYGSSVAPQSACPVLMLDEPLPSAQQRKWRMAQHRVARRTSARHETGAAEIGEHLDLLFRLHTLRWRDRGEEGVLADPALRRFHDLAAPALAAAGLLRMAVLVIDGAPAAAYYGFARGNRAHAYLGGFDPAFDFESPGTLLLGAAIADATRSGAAEFHFLRGREAYKYRWGARDRWNHRRVVASLT